MTATEIETTKTENTHDAQAWERELLFLLDELEGGTLDKLAKLLADVPNYPPTVFATLRSLSERFGAGKVISPLAAARTAGEGAMSSRVGNAGNLFEELFRRLTDAADRLIDAGGNDEVDPIIRVRDFAETGMLTHERNVGTRVVFDMRTISANHPIRTVRPLDSGSGRPYWVLGDHRLPSVRLGDVRRRTAEAIERHEYAIGEQKRLDDLRRENERRAFEASEAGKAAKLVNLEAELQRLKAGTVPTA